MQILRTSRSRELPRQSLRTPIGLAVVAFYAVALFTPAFIWVPLLVTMAMLTPPRVVGQVRLGRPLLVVVAAAFLYCLGGLLPFVSAPVTARGLVSVLKLAAVPLLAVAVWRLRGRDLIVAMWVGCCAGAVSAGVVAMAQVGLLGMDRAEGLTGNSITFGDLSLAMGALALGLYPLVSPPWARAPVVAASAMTMGSIACTLSGSRGAWLAAPVVFVVVAHVHRSSMTARNLRLMILAVMLVFGLSVVLSDGMPLERTEAVLEDVTDYVGKAPSSEERGTSIGARIEVWRSALAGFRTDPLLGVGWGNLPALFDRDVALGLRNARIATFDHSHNQLIEAMANGGIVGFGTTLAIFVAPGWVFWRYRRSDDDAESTVALVGVLVVVSFFVFAQTEASFDRLLPTCFYAVTVSALASRLGMAASASDAGRHP